MDAFTLENITFHDTNFNNIGMDSLEPIILCLMASTSQKGLRKHRWWINNRSKTSAFAKKFLEGSWLDEESVANLRVLRPVFAELCRELGSQMTTQDTQFRKCIPLELKIAMTL
ncbi:hypothetical protein CHUAL_010756 [Chamberlinius hualienensis]